MVEAKRKVAAAASLMAVVGEADCSLAVDRVAAEAVAAAVAAAEAPWASVAFETMTDHVGREFVSDFAEQWNVDLTAAMA